MTAMTAVHQARIAQGHKPPIAYTHDAIRAAIAHEAANGPSYVRIKALNMMARLEGMYDQAKLAARQVFEAAVEKTDAAVSELIRECRQIAADGVDLTDFSMYRKPDEDNDEQDDEEGTADDEEPQ